MKSPYNLKSSPNTMHYVKFELSVNTPGPLAFISFDLHTCTYICISIQVKMADLLRCKFKHCPDVCGLLGCVFSCLHSSFFLSFSFLLSFFLYFFISLFLSLFLYLFIYLFIRQLHWCDFQLKPVYAHESVTDLKAISWKPYHNFMLLAYFKRSAWSTTFTMPEI